MQMRLQYVIGHYNSGDDLNLRNMNMNSVTQRK